MEKKLRRREIKQSEANERWVREKQECEREKGKETER